MRIAHIITRMVIGGAQENTLLTCRSLREDYGDDVLLVTGPSPGPEGELLGQGGDAGVPVELVPSLRRGIRPDFDLAAYRALVRVLQRYRPDVVHTHSAKAGILGRRAAWALRTPVVVHTVHGAPFHPYQSRAARWLFRQCERYAADKCHAMVSVADAMTDLMVQAGVAPREKFTTVYSGMDVAPFLAADDHRAKTRRELGYADDQVVVGKIARLFHLKGHSYLIEAAAEVVRQRPDARFLLVGDGILRDRLTQLIRQFGLQDHFQLLGLVEPQRIPALLGAMDLLVHVSLREGLARTLPQALIAGRPVVSYDIDGAREVVITGETGCLLPPQSVQPLSDSIIQLVSDAHLRQRLGQCGRERFTDQFRYQQMTRQLRQLYQQLLGHSAG